MMSSNHSIESLFELFDKSSMYIQETFQVSYLEALIDTGESLFQNEWVFEELTKDQENFLENIRLTFAQMNVTSEDLRRAFQLATVKGMKQQAVAGTGITPDAVCMFIGYLAHKMIQPRVILDPAVGSGNLLTAVMNQYKKSKQPLQAFGTEVDPILIRLAYVNANLQEHEVELFHQDGLKPLYIRKPDLVVCDLPIGIYPNKEIAKSYDLYNDEHDTYTHHLFFEQAIRLAEDGAYFIFLIPNTLFTEPGAMALREMITNHTYIQAVLQLPDTMFQKGSIQKSIFILQKKGDTTTKPKETLMAQLPTFSKANEMSQMLQKINAWFEVNK